MLNPQLIVGIPPARSALRDERRSDLHLSRGVSFAVQGAGGGTNTAEVSPLWEAGAALASHPAPAALSETKSWAADQKTQRSEERVGH